MRNSQRRLVKISMTLEPRMQQPGRRKNYSQIINYRYINKLATVITTNLMLDEIEGRIRSRLQDRIRKICEDQRARLSPSGRDQQSRYLDAIPA